MKVLIAYESMSGNTQELAELLQEVLSYSGCSVTLYRIGVELPLPIVSLYDFMLFGTYTWGKGQTPKRTKQFVADIGYKPENIYLFGTGDTQFGGDLFFCSSLDKLANFYHVAYPVLKIEQSPRGIQELKVKQWAEGVLENEKTRNGKSLVARES